MSPITWFSFYLIFWLIGVLMYYALRALIGYVKTRGTKELKGDQPPEIASDQVSVDLKGINSTDDVINFLEDLEKATSEEEVIALTRRYDDLNYLEKKDQLEAEEAIREAYRDYMSANAARKRFLAQYKSFLAQNKKNGNSGA